MWPNRPCYKKNITRDRSQLTISCFSCTRENQYISYILFLTRRVLQRFRRLLILKWQAVLNFKNGFSFFFLLLTFFNVLIAPGWGKNFAFNRLHVLFKMIHLILSCLFEGRCYSFNIAYKSNLPYTCTRQLHSRVMQQQCLKYTYNISNKGDSENIINIYITKYTI